MRRSVVRIMSVVTLVVVGVSLRAGAQPSGSPVAVSRSHGVRPSESRVVPGPRPSGQPARTRTVPTTPRPRPSATAQGAAVGLRGDLVDTAYGPVRVRIVVKDRRIAEARAIVRPHGDGTTEQINGYAVPVLNQEAVSVQGSHIDTVSGATFTSEGYRRSLQSALDAAHQAGAL